MWPFDSAMEQWFEKVMERRKGEDSEDEGEEGKDFAKNEFFYGRDED